MNYKNTISSAVFFFIACFSRAQQNTITLRQAVEKFYTTYDGTSLDYPRVEFEKRKGDWYVKTIHFRNDSFIRSLPQLFYNTRTNSYEDLKFKTPGQSAVNYLDYVAEYDSYNFDLQSSYGYWGWFDDVINELERKHHLTNNELYALGRAYSSRAIAPISNLVGSDPPPNKMYKLAFDLNALTGAQQKRYIEAEDSAISKFRKLYSRDQEFATAVGDIRNKLANEIMVKFHLLLTFSDKMAKSIVLPPGIYSDSMLAIARSYLESCPPQSVLVSFGDNDFYPVLYLQQAQHLRNDVFLVNYNLLGVDQYIYRATQKQFNSPGIKLSIDTSIYKTGRNEIILARDTNAVLYFYQFINQLKDGKQHPVYQFELPANEILLNPQQPGVGTTPVISMKKIKYLYKFQWIFLDILYNRGSRPVVATNSAPLDFMLRGLFMPHSNVLIFEL